MSHYLARYGWIRYDFGGSSLTCLSPHCEFREHGPHSHTVENIITSFELRKTVSRVFMDVVIQ